MENWKSQSIDIKSGFRDIGSRYPNLTEIEDPDETLATIESSLVKANALIINME
jgi:hypothetical protein